MSPIENLWEACDLPGQLSLELHAGDHPALVLAQGDKGDSTVRIELDHARPVIAALTGAAADLAELLATGDRYHA